jgi:hypothetical protein
MPFVWSREHSRFFSPPLLIAVPLRTCKKTLTGEMATMMGCPVIRTTSVPNANRKVTISAVRTQEMLSGLQQLCSPAFPAFDR